VLKLIPQPGDKVGDFEIIRKLGTGGMGVVYEARQLSTGRRVALKILSPTLTRQKSRQRFLREAQAAARLQHPNIVTVYDICSEEDLVYYAMDFVDGYPLSRVIRKLPSVKSSLGSITQVITTGTGEGDQIDHQAKTVIPDSEGRDPQSAAELSESDRTEQAADTTLLTSNPAYIREVATMLREVARALDYAHSQGVIHRDIKPGNLLLDRSGGLHLVDFGLARVLDEGNITLSGELMGTPLYMSPEQVAAGRIGMDHRTDIYSLGVVAYHLLCLQPPYKAESREGLLRAIAVQSPPPLSSLNSSLPRDLETIVHHAMEKDPDRRYASGAELADDLDRWLSGKPIKVKRPNMLRRWWNAKLPGERRMIQACVGLLIAAGVAVFSLLPQAKKETAFDRSVGLAERYDYLGSALWHARAMEEDPSVIESAAMHRSIVLNELPWLHQRLEFSGREGCFDFDPTRPALVTGIAENRLQVWDLLSASPKGSFFETQRPIKRLSYNEPGTHFLLVMGTEQSDSAQLFMPDGKPIHNIWLPGMPILRYVRMAAEEGIVAFVSEVSTEKPTGGPDRPLYQVDVYSFQADFPPRRLKTLQSPHPVELSADGQYLAAVMTDGTLEVTNVLGDEIWPSVFVEKPAGFVFSPTTSDLAVVDSEGIITLFYLRTGALPLRFETLMPAQQTRRRGRPAHMQFNIDGTRLLVVGAASEDGSGSGRSVLLWDVQNEKRHYGVLGRRYDACFSRNGERLAVWDDEGVSLIRAFDGSRINRITAPVRRAIQRPHLGPIVQTESLDYPAVWMDNDGRRIVCVEQATGVDERISASVWDVATGERIYRLPIPLGPEGMAGLDPSGNFAFAFAGGEDTQCGFYLWDLRDDDGLYARVARLPALPIAEKVVAGDKPFVALAGINNQRPEWSLVDPRNAKPMGKPITQPPAIKHWLVSQDGTILFAVDADGRAHAFDLDNGQAISDWQLPLTASEVLALSGDGRLVAVAHTGMRVSLHYVIPGESEAVLPQIGLLTGQPQLIRFNRSGSLLAIADDQGGITINPIGESEVSYRGLNTGRPISDLVFCLDDSMLAVGHSKGEAGLWSLTSGRHIGIVDSVVGASGRSRLAVGGGLLSVSCDRNIRVYNMPARPDQSRQQLQPVSPPLESTHRIIALSFEQVSEKDQPPACRLFAVTEGGGLRWYDLSLQQYSLEQWTSLIAARTGMQLNDEGEPVFIPRDEWLTICDEVKQFRQ
jgi:serine/threonine protein kinase/WD40 repeat protein